MYKYSRFLYSMEVLPIYQKIDLFFLQCYTIICVKNSQSSKSAMPTKNIRPARIPAVPLKEDGQERPLRIRHGKIVDPLAQEVRPPEGHSQAPPFPCPLPSGCSSSGGSMLSGYRVCSKYSTSSAEKGPDLLNSYSSARWAATSWWVRARIRSQATSLGWVIPPVQRSARSKAKSVTGSGRGIQHRYRLKGNELTMTGRWSLLHWTRAERAVLREQIRCWRRRRRIGLILTRRASGRGTTTTQAGQENEHLWSLGGCWTRFLLSLVGAGRLPLGGSATSNTVGTPVAAD